MNRIKHSIMVLFLVFFIACLSGQESRLLHEVRAMYLDAGMYPEKRLNFLKSFNERKIEDPVLYSYYATAITMYAEMVKGKFNQYTTFNRGKEKLDSLINSHPDLAEPRYLRFHIQEHAPIFLNYNTRREDKKVIVRNIAQFQDISNTKLKKRIKELLLNSSYLSETDKNIVESNL